MVRIAYFLVLVGLLFGYYQLLGPGPTPSEFIDDLEWWRSSGAAHVWESFAGLERMAEAGGARVLVPLGLFGLPALALLVWGFRLFRSAALRTLCTTGFLVLVMFAYYGYVAGRVWRFFEWRSPAVAAGFAAITATSLFAPSLLRAALARSRAWAALALVVAFAAVFLLSTEITGTDANMRFNISPWPVLPLFGLLLVGSWIATLHIAAGAGTWLAARRDGRGGLAVGVLAAGVASVGLTLALLQAPSAATLFAMGVTAACYALVRARSGARPRGDLARTGLMLLVAGALALSMIHVANRAAVEFQKRARNETATRVLVALQGYREQHGSFPRRLDGLVPEFFEEVPRPRIGLILDEQDEFSYRNLGDSYLLEFASVQWVQCGYSPPFDVAKYSEEDYEEEDEDEEDEEQFQQERRQADPELEALLADQGLEGSWNCEDAPPKLW